MYDIPNWAVPLIALGGALAGSFVGVKLAVMELRIMMVEVLRRLDAHDKWMEAHDTQYAKDIQQFAVLKDRAGIASSAGRT